MGYGGAGLIVRAARAACVGVRAMQDASTLREPKHHVARATYGDGYHLSQGLDGGAPLSRFAARSFTRAL